MRYYVGQVARIKGTVTDTETEALVDPTKVIGTVIKPSGATEELPGFKVKTGEYKWEIPVTEDGRWELVGDGIGAHDTAGGIVWHADHRDAPRPT
jgi:hypothetical protein